MMQSLFFIFQYRQLFADVPATGLCIPLLYIVLNAFLIVIFLQLLILLSLVHPSTDLKILASAARISVKTPTMYMLR
jgi:hypothetical protein